MLSSAAPSIAPADISRAVEQAWAAYLLADRRAATPHPNYVYASSWRVCDRRMVLECTVPDQQIPFDAFTLARFRRGNDRERDILADLSRMGRNATPEFRLVGQQASFRLRDRKSREVISGKVDAFLEVDHYVDEERLGGVTQRVRRVVQYPIEVKSWAPQVVERLDTFADVFETPWTRSGGYQLLSYLFGNGYPVGFLVLDRGGIPKLLPVVLEEHLDRMEEFLSRAERVVDHALAGTLPPFLEGDANECKRCSFFGTACQPPLASGDIQVFTDEELELDLHRWNELGTGAKEWLSIDKRIKERLRGVVNGICGPFSITGKWGKSSRVELPDAVKKQHTVVDPKGKFFLNVEKVVDASAPAATPIAVRLQQIVDQAEAAR